jgi:microcystin-dependent protein
MSTPIKPKRSYTATSVPSGLSAGELAVNAADGKIWIGNSVGTGNVLISSLSLSDMTGTASTATNLAGGSGGTIPYQSAAGTTAMLANGTAGQLLQANGGTAAPSWVASPGVPTGSLFPYAGSSAPTGYLLCDGSAVARTGTYAALFAVIGTTYGSGDGSTTFNLPDLRGRMPLGAGTGVGLNASGTGKPAGTNQTARTAGQWLGNETVTLSSSNIPQMTTGYMSQNANHTHGPGSGQYFWVYNSSGANTVASGSVFKMSADASTATTASTNVDHTHTVGTASPTSTTNIPPSIVVNYIIKT